VCLVAALATVVRADDPLPPDVQEVARAAFAEAQAADQAGDLATAIERYRYLQKIAPHPAVTYNLADVLRRKRDLHGAAREYRAYLEQAPTAPDRAKVDKLIATIEATPGDVDLYVKDGDGAIVFVDGVRHKATPPLFFEMAPGVHRFDAVLPISFRSVTEEVEFDRDDRVTLTLPPRVDGNLALSGSGWLERAKVTIDGTTEARLGDKATAAAGKRTVVVSHDACQWRKTVAIPTSGIVYVYLTVPPSPRPAAGKRAAKPAVPPPCAKGRFAVTRLTFPPPPSP
jgi:hypothetical protein